LRNEARRAVRELPSFANILSPRSIGEFRELVELPKGGEDRLGRRRMLEDGAEGVGGGILDGAGGAEGPAGISGIAGEFGDLVSARKGECRGKLPLGGGSECSTWNIAIPLLRHELLVVWELFHDGQASRGL
jgi:hypothetical protein